MHAGPTHKPRRLCRGAAKGRALSPPWRARGSSLPLGRRVLRWDWCVSLSLSVLYPQLDSVRVLGCTDGALMAQSPLLPPVWRDKGKRFRNLPIDPSLYAKLILCAERSMFKYSESFLVPVVMLSCYCAPFYMLQHIYSNKLNIFQINIVLLLGSRWTILYAQMSQFTVTDHGKRKIFPFSWWFKQKFQLQPVFGHRQTFVREQWVIKAWSQHKVLLL